MSQTTPPMTLAEIEEGERRVRDSDAPPYPKGPHKLWLHWLEEMGPRLLSTARSHHCLAEQVGNLLARIHRDGGQYQTQHGTEKAFADAHEVWGERTRKIDTLAERVKELEANNKNLTERNAVLRARADLPADRVPAMERMAERLAAAEKVVEAASRHDHINLIDDGNQPHCELCSVLAAYAATGERR